MTEEHNIMSGKTLEKFSHIMRNSLQETMQDAIFDAQAYSDTKQYSTWPDEEDLYVREVPDIGICLVVLKSGQWYKTINSLLTQIDENQETFPC